MRFGVLGRLEVLTDGEPVPLGGGKQRILLAMLLLHANEYVSRDQLIDAMWGQRPPPSAPDALDTYVYRLRKLFDSDRLLREAGGYRLRVGSDEVDAEQFERLVTAARRAADADDHAAAVSALTQALGLWRGRAWADALDDPSVSAEAQRLEELRMNALELRIEAKLAMGTGAELVPELERLAAEHPLRERLLAGLMLALYRAGRQTDALETFQTLRRRLADELGLELGPELHDLQRRILRHDPSLGAQRRSWPALQPHRRTRWFVAGLALAVAVACAFVLGAGATDPRPALASGASGVVAIQAGSARVALATPLPGAPAAVVAGAGSLWVTDASDGTVSRLDSSTGVVVDTIPVGGEPASITSGDGAIWVASTDGATVQRISPAAEKVTQTISLPGADPDALAVGDGRVWVADSSTRRLYELAPVTGRTSGTVPLDVAPSALVFGAGALWVASYDRATVLKLDPTSGRVLAHVRVGTGADSMTFASGALWVANGLDSTVSRIDPISLTVTATIPVGSGPSALVADKGSVWVANQYSGSVSRIEPRRNAVAGTVAVGGSPTSLTVLGGRVWAGVAASDPSHRRGSLRVASAATFASIDPAFFDMQEPPAFEGLAYDTLVTFDHTDGVDGLRLVPDLALTLPTPIDGGRTYTFHLRPGIRYWTGVPVLPSDFRRAVERLFEVGSPGRSFYTDIIGAAGCLQRPPGCDLSHGIVTNDATGTIVFHLRTPDAEFLYRLTEEDYTAPVPPGTPHHDMGLDPFPGTGPYRIARAGQTGVRFVRNPFFHEWSDAAQPEGNPNVIVWRYLPSEQDAARAVQDGRADWLNGPVPLHEYRQLALQSPTQLHSQPLFGVEFLPFNTHRAPFNNLLVRRALNDAIDRNLIARMYGGPAFATPTCQPLAPGLPGYRRYCPYTSHPRADGAYTGPDLIAAERLVARSRTRGQHVTVWGSPNEGYVPREVPFYVASVLRSLGYRTTVRLRPFADVTNAMYPHFQLSTNGDWLSDYPDPSSYLPQFFGCNGGNSNGYVCDPALDREMREAERLEVGSPAAADALWTTIDHTLTDQADWVPTVSVREVDLVSTRLGNYQFNPVWGFLPDQSWLREPRCARCAG